METSSVNQLLFTLEEKVHPRHSAIIVVDMQNAFCHPEGYLHKLGVNISSIQAMVPRLEHFLAQARKAKIEIIFIQAIYDKKYLAGPFLEKDCRAGLKEERCVEGSWDADFFIVGPLPSETVVQKHRYSAFVGTTLDQVLRQKGISTLIMTGVTTNVCVESTARDGFMRDYYIVFLRDCTATYRKEVHEFTLANIEKHFGVVTDSNELLRNWESYQDGR